MTDLLSLVYPFIQEVPHSNGGKTLNKLIMFSSNLSDNNCGIMDETGEIIIPEILAINTVAQCDNVFWGKSNSETIIGVIQSNKKVKIFKLERYNRVITVLGKCLVVMNDKGVFTMSKTGKVHPKYYYSILHIKKGKKQYLVGINYRVFKMVPAVGGGRDIKFQESQTLNYLKQDGSVTKANVNIDINVEAKLGIKASVLKSREYSGFSNIDVSKLPQSARFK